MDKEKIKRINELSKKSRESGLTEAEKAEQTLLRNEYRAQMTANFTAALENTYIREEDGTQRRLLRKEEEDK